MSHDLFLLENVSTLYLRNVLDAMLDILLTNVYKQTLFYQCYYLIFLAVILNTLPTPLLLSSFSLHIVTLKHFFPFS